MPFKVQNSDHLNYIEADPTGFIIRHERDMLDLIAACSEHDVYHVLLHEGNLSPEFFDLKTTLAGAVFQKFANYQLRGAAVISLGAIKNERFKELVFECNRGNLFRFFEDKAAAEAWLVEE
jgi:hypothetical protein